MVNKKALLLEVRGWVITILGAFVLASLISTKVFAKVQVQQQSMENTLFQGQQLLVDKISYDFSSPKRDDIVIILENRSIDNFLDSIGVFMTDISDVFRTQKINSRIVKRVIGVPGDEVDIKEGSVFVNGQKLEEPYVKGQTFAMSNENVIEFPVKVPEGKVFVLGDNREVSKDSRIFGLVDLDKIEGKAVFRIWPLSKAGTIK